MGQIQIKTINIHGIRDKYAINQIRGIMHENDLYRISKALENIEKRCSPIAYKKSLDVIRGSNLFIKNLYTRDFNRICPRTLDSFVKYSSEEILEKINKNQDKISSLMNLFLKTYKEIRIRDYERALDTCELIINEEGVSCFLIRVLYHIRVQIEDEEKYSEVDYRIELLLNKIQISNVSYIETAIRELSNIRTDYFNISAKIETNEIQKAIFNISKSFVSHVVRNKEEFEVILSSYYSFSLIDAFVYYQSSMRLELPFMKDDFDKGLSAVFKKISKIKFINNNLTNEDVYDIRFFRCSFLLIELDDNFKYKTIHGGLYNKNELKQSSRIAYENKILRKYFKNVKSINDLRTSDDVKFGLNFSSYNSKNCTNLENSNALVYLLEKSDGEISGLETEFVKVMSNTMDIGIICPTIFLINLSKKAKSNYLKLVISCLISIKNKSDMSEKKMRKLIQSIAVDEYDHNLTKLIGSLQPVSPSVAEHLVDLCDENFLMQCYKIVSVPNEAIEIRSSMLQWYGDLVNDSIYLDKAKNLRIDVQINKQKEAIDDHRIYVDPIKFSYWIGENILDKLTLLFDQVKTDDQTNLSNVNWDTVHNGLYINEQIASLLVQCYQEFCNNNIFGIASYLGRRIRHGTFKGTALEEVRELCKDEKYQGLFENQEFCECYHRWISKYELMLDDLALSSLHIKSKEKPEGMISSHLNTKNKQKIAGKILLDKMVELYLEKDSSRQFPTLIIEACWRCIDEDLENIRRFLMRKKSNYGVFNFQIKPNRLEQGAVTYSSFSQDLNLLIAGKFRDISEWFNKPTIVSPSANLSLLYKAVLSEIKSYKPLYKPNELNDDSLEFIISGGVYFIIYDALYILIYNAAVYGKKTGDLEFTIVPHFEENKIEITIVSETNSDDADCAKAKYYITKALEEDYTNANVIEGRSGIKKLNRMKADGFIEDFQYRFYDNRVSASFNFHLGYTL